MPLDFPAIMRHQCGCLGWPRIIIFLGLLIMLTGCADRLLLYPSTEPLDADGATPHRIPTPAGHLEVWSARSSAAASKEPEAFVLAFTGNATRAEQIATSEAAVWDPHPVEVWTVNYPGYGTSTGPATLSAIAPAAIAAYDALQHRAGSRPIYISAASLGTTAALYTAAHRPAAGLVLRNPPPIRQMIITQYGWWNLWLLAGPLALSIPSELNSLSNAASVHAPAIFIMSGQDEVVPPRYQRMVLSAYAGETHTIALPNATHNTPLSESSLHQLRTDIDWLWELRAR